MIDAFTTGNLLGTIGSPRQGMSTCDVNRFVKRWYEVSLDKTNIVNRKDYSNWVIYNNGGSYRKWYGNRDCVVLWHGDGDLLRQNNAALRNRESYFKDFIAWNKISTTGTGFRSFENDFLFDGAGGSYFLNDSAKKNYVLGCVNSIVIRTILHLISPTINFNENHIGSIPILFSEDNTNEIESFVQENISISKQDWDAHETSWDFKENELVRVFKERNTPDLKSTVYAYEREWDEKFEQLHNNEEELNRLFIEIYGLQDELSCEVSEEEVTILQQGEIFYTPAPGSENWMTRVWFDANIIQQFISYAMGCYMGRYRLDRPGLHIAHPNPTAEELAPYEVSCPESRSPESFTIDDDGIIPILPLDAPFPDNAANRITNFVKLVFGSNKLTDNMNFIQDALGMSVADYMTKNFYTDHKKRYQNRPIYWLFSSKKGAFQCLVYMHRMNRFTVGRIRDNYLLHYIRHLENKLADFELRAAMLSSDERRELKRTQTALQECREYDNILHQYADRQISIDLDDGVLHNYALFKDILAKLK